MRRTVLVALFFAGSAASQEMPNPVDLKSAYCVRLLSSTIPKIAELSKAIPADRPDLKGEIEERIHSFEQARGRLQSYLLPRMPSLDLLGIMGATTQADDDMAEAIRAIATCSRDQDGQCRSPAVLFMKQKTESCRDVSWLPF